MRTVLAALGAETELAPLLDRIVRAACQLLDADHGTIGLLDEEAGVVRTRAGHNMPASEVGAEMAVGVGIAGEVLRTGRALAFARYGDVPTPTQPDMLDHAVVGMPIVWHQGLIGVFGIGRAPRKGRAAPVFTRADFTTLRTFARYAAIAITSARQYRAEQERAERFALVTRVGRIVTADLNLEELLQRAADAVHEILGYPNTAIPLIEPADPEVLRLRVTGGSYKGIVRGEHRQSIHTGIMGAAAVDQRPVLVNDVASDPRYIVVPGSQGIVAELAVPILLGDRCLGVLNVESDNRFTQNDVDVLRIVADQLAIAIENARLHASARNIAAVEERHHLARDLHDSVTQILFSMTLVAQSLEPAWRRDPDEGARRGHRLLELSQQALAEMRALLVELRSAEDATSRISPAEAARRIPQVRDQGLFAALRALARAIGGEGLGVRIRTSGTEPVEARVADAVYRIAQEALNNVAKHARATRVRIVLECMADEVRLLVDDDGIGVVKAIRTSGKRGGMGVAFMKERAEVLGGSLELIRGVSRGTRVLARIPLRTPPT
ncbi:MAG: GAF domain-containing sensor histidine kinase [Gemmatimonadaceae bacterium]|nr:GAF domain-containing sensor histidine kinase [Gemmatimonadaceae bacterium]